MKRGSMRRELTAPIQPQGPLGNVSSLAQSRCYPGTLLTSSPPPPPPPAPSSANEPNQCPFVPSPPPCSIILCVISTHLSGLFLLLLLLLFSLSVQYLVRFLPLSPSLSLPRSPTCTDMVCRVLGGECSGMRSHTHTHTHT